MVAVGISIARADALEKRLKVRMPNTRPYKWGFYVGCMSIAFAILPLLAVMVAIVITVMTGKIYADIDDTEFFPFILVFIHGFCGFFIIKRKRWAWIVSIIFSFNPFVWIINGIYAGRRWREFAEESGKTSDLNLKVLPTTKPFTTNSSGNNIYFVMTEGQEKGPYTFNQLSSMWYSGQLPANTHFRLRDVVTWYPLIDLLESKKT